MKSDAQMQDVPTKPESEATLAAPLNSEAATGTQQTVRAMRLVLQLEDTPENRETVKLASIAIRTMNRKIEGAMGVLKVEEINIVEWNRPAPLPNDPSSATAEPTR